MKNLLNLKSPLNSLYRFRLFKFCADNKISYDQYIKEADRVMNLLFDKIDEKEFDITDNINLSAGVLSFTFRKNKNYVLNVQRPNLQIWLSSPISGPQRYEFDLSTNKWINVRSKKDLLELLGEEINSILDDNGVKDKLELKY
jgi:frataxin